MPSWAQGRPTVDRLLREQRIQRVPPNREFADTLIAQAELHLEAAEAVRHIDSSAAFQIVYDAARKALTAILINEGLRAKGVGGHAVLLEVTKAQLDPPMGPILDEFGWMRRLRNDTEYPTPERQVADAQDVNEALPAARMIIDSAKSVVRQMPAY